MIRARHSHCVACSTERRRLIIKSTTQGNFGESYEVGFYVLIIFSIFRVYFIVVCIVIFKKKRKLKSWKFSSLNQILNKKRSEKESKKHK